MSAFLRIGVFLPMAIAVSVCMAQWSPAVASELLDAMEMNRIHFERLGDFQLRYEMIYFLDQNDPKASERHTLRIRRRGNRYRSEQLGILTIQDEHIRVTVDSSSAIVMLATPGAMVAEQASTWRDQIIPLARSIGKQETRSGTRFRVLLPPSTGYEAVEAMFDMEGWLLELVLMYDRSPQATHLFTPILQRPKLVTRFSRPEVLQTNENVGLDPGSIVDLTTSRPELRSRWSSYQLIDTRYR